MARERVGDRLRGATIVLIAASPAGDEGDSESTADEVELSADEIIAGDDAAAAVDEAVIALARAVLSERGTLAVRDDPYTAMLVAQIAGEYWEPAPIENMDRREPLGSPPLPVLIYGGDSAFTKSASRSPFVASWSREEIDPVAIVLVAGTRHDRAEAGYWKPRSGIVYVIPAGRPDSDAATAQERGILERLRGVRRELAAADRDRPQAEFRGEEERKYAFSHYPLLMQQIVDEIAVWWREHRGLHQ